MLDTHIVKVHPDLREFSHFRRPHASPRQLDHQVDFHPALVLAVSLISDGIAR
jgi:hypothetical protein